MLSLAVPPAAAPLVKSRERNRSRGITGMLLYKDGCILQIIEGEESNVVSLAQAIEYDPRHSGFMMLYRKKIEERDFPDWTMGFREIDASQAAQQEGFSEFFQANFDMRSIKSSAAAKLLNSFKIVVR